ncbi:TMEM165/GDT1 family protein [Edwardsiella piscicida]|nr:TMEM165/GDT1 family protein [Edwardsiella piscicida]AOP41570.2 TMEM165/GDT1 family protein [Edwardsiella piscicida]MDM3866142.1 TMEM165/GDT1 family protein [Edwardsiella piscicida]UCQ14748.1 TMEM165/GDT1 family protein [Edwardsiella piscicida]UCQ21170.1 TMEM165/GDT1 family protein [Edwardsiella piscicida]UCQ24508.1 TMEM165/GDT1 family protein [Edwardsiella piscicida]
MSIILTSMSSVALAEIGDKTQLLTLLLVARFGKPFLILLAIILATLVNHYFAALIGELVTQFLSPQIMRWMVAAGFLAMAVWVLFPDKDDGEIRGGHPFWTSLVVFFLAEIGDKTQIATVLLGAHYQHITWVVLGSTLGMVLANAPMLWFGARLQPYLKSGWGRRLSSLLFAILGVVTLIL